MAHLQPSATISPSAAGAKTAIRLVGYGRVERLRDGDGCVDGRMSTTNLTMMMNDDWSVYG